jgi:hypothetical protein
VQPTGSSPTPAVSGFGSLDAVLRLAEASRWRAPDATAVLAEHAKRLAGAAGDTAGGLRAEAWLAHGLVAIGRGVSAVPLAAAALPRAVLGADSEVEARLRVELASVAHDLGEAGHAESLLAPVRDRRDLPTALRADIAAQAAVLHPQNQQLVDAAVGLLRQLGGEAGELGMARVDALLAQQLSEHGQPEAAIRRARDGLRTVLGERPTAGALEPVAPHLALRLAVELSLALVKVGHRGPINEIAEPMLGWQARSASLVPATRLRLALAGQVQLPAGEHREALAHIDWVSRAIAGEDLPELEAECHQVRAKLAEARGESSDALAAGRTARLAHRLHNTRVEHARQLLAEVAGDKPAAALPRNGRATTDSPLPSRAWTEQSASAKAERIERPPYSSAIRNPVWGDGEIDPEAVWLSPTEGRAVPEATSPSTGRRWLLAAELAEELASPNSTRPAHLVVVDIATPSGSVGGWARTALAAAVADQVRGQLDQGSLLHLLAPDIVTIALPQTDPRAVNRWVRAVSGKLSRQWPALSADLPHATFRIAIRPLDLPWSMEEHVRDVSAQLLDGRESKARASLRPGSQEGPLLGRHAGASELAGSGATPDWLNAPPGSGGRRRRPDVESDAAPRVARLGAEDSAGGPRRLDDRSGHGRSPEPDPLTGDINGLVAFAGLAGFDDLATFNEVPDTGSKRRRGGVPDTPSGIEESGGWDFSRYHSAHQPSDAVDDPIWDELPGWDEPPSRGELPGWDEPPRPGELLGFDTPPDRDQAPSWDEPRDVPDPHQGGPDRAGPRGRPGRRAAGSGQIPDTALGSGSLNGLRPSGPGTHGGGRHNTTGYPESHGSAWTSANRGITATPAFEGSTVGIESTTSLPAQTGLESTAGLKPAGGVGSTAGLEPTAGVESTTRLEPAGGVGSTAGLEPTAGVESTTRLGPAAGIESTTGLKVPKGPEATTELTASANLEAIARLRASASPETTAKLAARRGGQPADFHGQPALAGLDDLGAEARRSGDVEGRVGRRRAQPAADETGSDSGATRAGGSRAGGRGRDDSAGRSGPGRHDGRGGSNTAEARPDPGAHRGGGARNGSGSRNLAESRGEPGGRNGGPESRNGALDRNGAGDRAPGSPLAADAVTSTAWLPVGGRGASGAVNDSPAGPDRSADERAVPTANDQAGRAAGMRDKTPAQGRDGEQDAAERDRVRDSEAEKIRRRNLDRPVSELTFAELIDGALAAYREA